MVWIAMLSARILVVEDEALVAAAVETCLRNLGHQVAASVVSGEEAVRKAVTLDPDLILMDIRLKGKMDGIEAAERIHRSLRIPVIYLTAHSDDETLLRARVTEPYGYVLKPFDEKTLKAVIEMTLFRAAGQAAVRRSRDRLAAILDGLEEAVLVTDVKGQVTYCNPASERLTGCRRGETEGRMLSEVFQLVDENGSPALLPASHVLVEGRPVALKGMGLRRRDEDHRPVDLQLNPVRDEAGIIDGLILSFHEILM